MAEVKYLDLNGLKKVFGIVDEKITGATSTINAEVNKKADKTELEAYLTKTEAEQTYIKEHQSLAEYAKKSEVYTKGEVDEAISDVKDEILGEDLAEALETLETVKNWKEEHGTEYSNLLAEVNKKADAETVSSTYATKAEVSAVEAKIPTDYLTEEDIEDFITEEYVDDAIKALNIEQYAKTADLPTFVAFSDAEIEAASKGE